MQLTDLNFLFDDNPQPMWIYDLSSLLMLKVNKAATAKYGYSEEEFLNMRITDLRPEEEQEKFYAYLKRKGITRTDFHGINYGGIWKHRDKNNNVVFVEITSHDVKFQNKDCRVGVRVV